MRGRFKSMTVGTGPQPRAAPKYQNQRALGVDQHGKQREYDSIKEARYSTVLMLRQRAGEIASWKPQVSILLTINGKPLRPYQGKKDAVYRADFLVTLPDGTTEIHEVKGYQNDKDPITRLWRLKLGIVMQEHPEWRIVMA